MDTVVVGITIGYIQCALYSVHIEVVFTDLMCVCVQWSSNYIVHFDFSWTRWFKRTHMCTATIVLCISTVCAIDIGSVNIKYGNHGFIVLIIAIPSSSRTVLQFGRFKWFEPSTTVCGICVDFQFVVYTLRFQVVQKSVSRRYVCLIKVFVYY